MQFENGAHVHTSKNEKLGHIDRVVLDPITKKVSHLVVRKGTLLKTDKVLPIEWVAAANGDHVVLTPEAGSFDSLPEFEEEHYVRTDDPEATPELERAGATGSASPVVAPAVLWYPPAFGVYPGPSVTGVTLPPRVRYVKTVEENIPENTVALKEGAKVLSADHQDAGRVERLVVDPNSLEVTHLVLTEGLLNKKFKSVPSSWISEAFEDEVHLAVDAELLRGLPEYTG
jgi:uncharacterized protein YrrD